MDEHSKDKGETEKRERRGEHPRSHSEVIGGRESVKEREQSDKEGGREWVYVLLWTTSADPRRTARGSFIHFIISWFMAVKTLTE